ncbi:hypothetical protein BDY17DRAFT_278642 [Neohortaea acidophila]|uniref:HTH APSES-type domain-containing protein n=1 Tax=Neohortaea acidophila TaxID=245834 RepID=A0A6A6PWL1_9PEZI|nr:uncharacterized protein BDY17DRAFT_278642 [Neohortaea acidophila]KAF2484121.1 hypothetical protein BDY17DRAFT_278642 [Neohortaea acidophila]
MSRGDAGKIYSATYSNVPVYELTVESNHVMRRRSDDWINATHILKVADYDKPARTRILEREVQKGVHEKVQGGYGKYQGTWIPLSDGKDLATKNGVFEKLRPIFEFVPGDRSPPPAPKHATAASSKPRVPRAPPQPRRQPVYQPTDYDHLDHSMRDDETPDNLTVVSEQAYDDYDQSQYSNSRKRRRVEDMASQADKDHQLWAEELLDYFVLRDPMDSMSSAPAPPVNVNLDRPIDDKGYTALHWAAAMGDIEVVKDLIRRGALIETQSRNGETPLMRSVIFTNSFDRQIMEKLGALLVRTINMQDWSGSTVFHHIANTTQRKSKYACARYYMDCLLNKMVELLATDDIERILNSQDGNGDTAITIAARHGARKCVRSLLGRNAAVDVPNHAGETADQLIVQLNQRRQERANPRQLSSSPFQADNNHSQGGPVQAPNGIPFDPLNPSLNGTSSQTNGSTPDVYKSETALTLTAQIFPVLITKAKDLAASIDAEIAEKDAELAEAERVAAMRRGELELLKRQQEELRIKELEQTSGGAVDREALEKELEGLEKECEELERDEQGHALRQEYARQKLARRSNGHEDHIMTDGANDTDNNDAGDALIRTQLALARQLAQLKRQRLDLIRQIVVNLSTAGFGGGDKQSQYKRLITGALGVKEEDVEGLLPEIVAELEVGRGLEAAGA